MSLAFTEAGSPNTTTLVFLHGMGVGAVMWRPQFQQLTEFHCLAPDLPGHGQSEAWQSQAATTQKLAALIAEHAQGGRAHIIGLSLGAQIGLRLACDFPERVETLLVSGLNILPIGKFNEWALAQSLPLMKQGWMIKLTAQSLKVPAEDYAAFREANLQLDLDSLRRASPEVSNYALPNLAQLQARTLLVAGQKEVSLIHHSLRELKRRQPAWQTAYAPKVGHVWNYEAPELFSRMVRTWVTGQPLPSELLPTA